MREPIGVVPARRTSRSGRGGSKDLWIRIELGAEDAKLLREILTKDLHQLEAEVAGQDWQDLGEAMVMKETLLRRLVGDLAL